MLISYVTFYKGIRFTVKLCKQRCMCCGRIDETGTEDEGYIPSGSTSGSVLQLIGTSAFSQSSLYFSFKTTEGQNAEILQYVLLMS